MWRSSRVILTGAPITTVLIVAFAVAYLRLGI
jgi:hypothetical protein